MGDIFRKGNSKADSGGEGSNKLRRIIKEEEFHGPSIYKDIIHEAQESNSAKGKAISEEKQKKETDDRRSFTIMFSKEKINGNRLVLPADLAHSAFLMNKNKVSLNCRDKTFEMHISRYNEFKRGNLEVPMVQLLGRWDIICKQRPSWFRKKVLFSFHKNQPIGSDTVSMTAFLAV